MLSEEVINEAVEKFLASKSELVAKKYRKNLLMSVKHLDTLKTPNEEMYEGLQAYLSTIPSEGGRYNGILPMPKTVNDRLSIVREFYSSLRGEATIKMFDDEIVDQQPANSDKPEISGPVKRGRKPKSADEKPVQLSIYLKPELYKAVKDLISNRESISETVSRLLSWYVKKNEAVLEARRLKMQELEAIQPADLN